MIATGELDEPLGEVSDELGQDPGGAAVDNVGAGDREEDDAVDGLSQGAAAPAPLDGRALLSSLRGAARAGTKALLRAGEKQEPEPLPWHQEGETSEVCDAPRGSDKAH